MKRVAILGIFFLFLLVGATWQIYRYDIRSFNDVKNSITRGAYTAVEEVPGILPTSKEVSTPPPLRGPSKDDEGTLTTQGVFVHTNEQRANNGASPLTRNTLLDAAATNKLHDMFEKQYFDHVSPDGKGPADVVEGVQYEYIRVGENLALGNFGSDEALVQAWMDSPGHRANIVSPGFTEIGIAVGQGMFEGKRTWLAVQTFGTPITECSKPNELTLQRIEQLQAETEQLQTQITSLQNQLSSTKETIEAIISEAQKLAAEGNRKVEEGNEQIEQGNKTYEETGSREEAEPYWNRGEELQAEGRALLAQAEAKQQEADRLNETYENTREEYNRLVTEYNNNANQLEPMIKEYNQAVRIFNECVESFSA